MAEGLRCIPNALRRTLVVDVASTLEDLHDGLPNRWMAVSAWQDLHRRNRPSSCSPPKSALVERYRP